MKYFIGIMITILIIMSSYSKLTEEKRYETAEIIKSGCLQKKAHKGRSVVDCRAEIKKQDGMIIRKSLPFSVLPEDKICLEYKKDGYHTNETIKYMRINSMKCRAKDKPNG